MTDQPTNDDDGPITPDSVQQPRRGAAGRKRRTGGDPLEAPSSDTGDLGNLSGDGADGGGPGRRRSTGTMFRAGCLLLIAIGVLQIVMVGAPYLISTDSVRCTGARAAIETANDDDEDFNDVDLPEGVDNIDDLDCAVAIDLAGNIPDEEGDEPSGEFVTESAIRTQGIIFTVISVAMAASGFALLRTRNRRARTVALVTCALGILFPLLSFASLLGLAFVVYAIAFSADAKAIFGQGTGFLRPRPPRQAS